MIYLVTNSFNTASWIYFGRREEGGRIMNIDDKVITPTGCALYPKEFLSWPPRSYVERMYNIFHNGLKCLLVDTLLQWKNQNLCKMI